MPFDMKRSLETYLPILVLAGSFVYGYATLASDVDRLKDNSETQTQTAVSVVRLEEQQKATKEVVDKLDRKLDEVLAELRKN